MVTTLHTARRWGGGGHFVTLYIPFVGKALPAQAAADAIHPVLQKGVVWF